MTRAAASASGRKASRGRSRRGRVVAVTGTSEFLGQGLLGLMESDPSYDALLAVDVREPPRLGPKAQFRSIDLTSPEAGADLAALFREGRVDTLAHLAFPSNPSHDAAYSHELLVAGTMHLLNAAAAAGVRKVVMLGSTMSYGARPDNPNFLTEDLPLRGTPGCDFVDDLIDTERQLAQFADKNPKAVTTVLRMGSMLGDEVDTFMARLLRHSVVPVVMGHDPLVQFVHEDDALSALKLAVDGDHPGPFNIVADGVLPMSTVLRLAGRLPLPIPHFLAERMGGFLWTIQSTNIPPSFLDYLRFLWTADGSRARQSLGFWPRRDACQTLRAFLEPERQSRTFLAAGSVRSRR
ncbi:MAG: NAD-dependent epimerase/dehydratase family protein [Deltaproteobacteria bacterium]|nr:NAD-dependent epimerase/dehydratase family protein [Deltaproteobacteria bacterium]